MGCEFARQELEHMRVNRQCGNCGMIWYYVPPAAGCKKVLRLGKGTGNGS